MFFLDKLIGSPTTTFTSITGALAVNTSANAGYTLYVNGTGGFTSSVSATSFVDITNTDYKLTPSGSSNLHSAIFDSTLSLISLATGTSSDSIVTISTGNIVNKRTVNNVLSDTITTNTDANVTISAIGMFKLPTPTANRTVALPTPSSFTGNVITIWNRNTSGTFTWSWSTNAPLDAAGNTLTTLVNTSFYLLESDGTNWVKIN